MIVGKSVGSIEISKITSCTLISCNEVRKYEVFSQNEKTFNMFKELTFSIN